VALIGKNLTNKITAAGCTSSNIANASIFGGQITGGVGRGPAGVDEVACYADRGRELWVRLTLRPFGK
jgi:iron complex outermembrane receptor protein